MKTDNCSNDSTYRCLPSMSAATPPATYLNDQQPHHNETRTKTKCQQAKSTQNVNTTKTKQNINKTKSAQYIEP